MSCSAVLFLLLAPIPLLSASLAQAGDSQCAQDNRTNKNAGIHITDFIITGTQAISATDLARITADMIGSCFDENSEEIEERVRASFQNRGYFKMELKSLRIKPRDPLGVPKPVTLEGEISEGPQYRLADINFTNNHAFSFEELRQQFPIKTGELFEREKIVAGLMSLRKLYATRGFVDWMATVDTEFGSNATTNLNLGIEEGTQYHMGKLEFVGGKEAAGRLRAEWKLSEGDIYDPTYIDDFLSATRDLLPQDFGPANVQTIQNCPAAAVEVRLILDPSEDKSAAPKNIPCEEHSKNSKREQK